MLHEYAIRPDDIARDWQTFNYITEKFGVTLGRVISDFPRRKWAEIALQKCRIHGLNRKRVEAWLEKVSGPERQTDPRYVILVDGGREYETDQTWTANMEREHAAHPFHAVISNQRSDNAQAYHTDDVWGSDLWKAATGDVIERDADQISEMARPLLRYSREVLLVDPYFRPYEERFRKTFESLIEVIEEESVELGRFEIHLGVTPKGPDSIEDFDRYSREHLSPLLSPEQEVLLYRWESEPQADRMHPRYILTEEESATILA